MTAVRVVAVTGNPASPSRTRALAQNIVEEIGKHLAIEAHFIELAEVGPVLGQVHHRKQLPPAGENVLRLVESADLLVAATPVYRASYTGLFKHLFDLIGIDALAGIPVVLAATGGSERHALVIDHELRPLFSFFRSITAPTGIYATEADFDNYQLSGEAVRQRIAAAVKEALGLVPPSAARAARLRAIA
jgi:FMN reductase